MTNIDTPPVLMHDQWSLFPVNERAFTHPPNYVGEPDILPGGMDWREAEAVLLPYQQKWLSDQSKIKLCQKSRRIGISWAEAADAVLTACSDMNVYYCGYNYDMAYTFIQDCAYWAKAFNLAIGEVQELTEENTQEVLFENEDKDILGYKIRFTSGYEIKALSSKPTNFRSKKGKVILDEFAFHHDPQGLRKAVTALLMWGGKLVVISTHNGISSEFNNWIQEINNGESDASLHTYTFKEAIADGLYKRICRMEGIEWTLEREFAWIASIYKEYGVYASEELDVIPSTETDSLFLPASLDLCFVGKWEEPQPKHFYAASLDPNFGGSDQFALLIWDVTKTVPKLVAEYCDVRQSSTQNQKSTIELLTKYKVYFLGIERNSGGIIIAENLQEKMPRLTIETFVTTQTSKIVATDSLGVAVEDGDLIFPSDWKGRKEFETFSKKKREAMVGKDDRVMSAAIFRHFLQQALELKPKMSKPVAGDSKIRPLRT